MTEPYAPGSPEWWVVRQVANGDVRCSWYELTDEDRAALVAAPHRMKMLVDQVWLDRGVATDPDSDTEAGSPPMPVDPLEEARERLEAAREAFLDLIADAKEWHEEGDEDGFHYTLRTTAHSLLPLMTAFGIEPLTYTEVVADEPFLLSETPAQAIYRACNETPTIIDDDQGIVKETPA